MMFREIKFYNAKGERIDHLEYDEKANTIVIEGVNGKERIPADGLRKEVIWVFNPFK